MEGEKGQIGWLLVFDLKKLQAGRTFVELCPLILEGNNVHSKSGLQSSLPSVSWEEEVCFPRKTFQKGGHLHASKASCVIQVRAAFQPAWRNSEQLSSVSVAKALLQPLVKWTFFYGSIFSFCQYWNSELFSESKGIAGNYVSFEHTCPFICALLPTRLPVSLFTCVL